jgi:predicted porin
LAATGAFAQSSVTLYGIVDLGYQSTKATVGADTVKQAAMANGTQSGSRVGFKGTEDLGGGLKANFVIEAGIKPDEGDMEFGKSNRQSYVGLEGGFGTLNLGRQYTLHHSNQGAGDLFGNVSNAGYIGGLDSLVRASNAFTYTSPSFSGFTVAAQMGLGETVTSATVTEKANELTAFRLAYANGPVAAGFAHETVKNATAAISEIKFAGLAVASDIDGLAVDKRVASNLFASYDLGVAKVAFVNNNSKFTVDGDGSAKWKANTLTASVPMGAATLLAGFGNGKITADGETDSIKAKAYQLGASYALSKRTNVFAFTGQTKLSYSADAAATGKVTQTTVGVRHSF